MLLVYNLLLFFLLFQVQKKVIKLNNKNLDLNKFKINLEQSEKQKKE